MFVWLFLCCFGGAAGLCRVSASLLWAFLGMYLWSYNTHLHVCSTLIPWPCRLADAVSDFSRAQSSSALCFHPWLFFLFHPPRKQGLCCYVCKPAAFCWQPCPMASELTGAGFDGGRGVPELLGLWLCCKQVRGEWKDVTAGRK